MFLPKKSDREQKRSLQLTPPSQFGTQVVVRLVTGRAAVTKISVSFMCVHCLSVSPLQSPAVHADACPGTKRGITRHKQYPPHTFILHMAFKMKPPAGAEGRRDTRTGKEGKKRKMQETELRIRS